MYANIFIGKQSFQFDEKQIATPIGNQVLIRVEACGVCGTDVHIYHGEEGSAEVVQPVVLGHEFAGTVCGVGDMVCTLRNGDHVAVDPNLFCGKCTACRMGRKQLCQNLKATGVTSDGGFAQYCLLSEEQCYRLDNNISFTLGAMAEPIACCLHGIDRAKIKQGESVLVIGGGAIGLIMVQLARLSGASKVVLSEPVEMRRKIGLAVGADAAIDPVSENLNDKLLEILETEGANVVIECAGNVAAASQAVAAAGYGAKILFFSVPSVNAIYELNLFDVYKKELTILGSFINPDTFQRAINLINTGRIDLAPLITHTYPLKQLEEAILMQKSEESIKVCVLPQIID